jgi:hypothetical protein
MYHLEVFYEGSNRPRETVSVERAAAVLAEIPKLLESHPACARVEVWSDSTRLFAVDCAGNRLP